MSKLINWWKGLEKVNGMRIIRNRAIPFPGYKAMFFMGLLFAKPNAKLDKITVQHESIHRKQWIELMPFGLLFLLLSWWFIFLVPFTFYIWYVAEWIIRIIIGQKDAYKNISFEKDAYICQENPRGRKRYNFFKYIR